MTPERTQGEMAIVVRVLVFGIFVVVLVYYNVWNHVVGALHDGFMVLWRRVAGE
jgi:hypothetical protein